MLNNIGFLTLHWPCHGIRKEKRANFFVIYGFKQNNHAEIYTIQSPNHAQPINKFYAKTAFRKLVRAIDVLKQLYMARRVKNRQNKYFEELISVSCHPDRLIQIDSDM
jgi:hypothetical protein